jgi:hypothetical protein
MLPYILATMPPVAILQGGGGTIDIDIGISNGDADTRSAAFPTMTTADIGKDDH